MDFFDDHPLPGFLDLAVPVEIMRLADSTPEQRQRIIDDARPVIAYRGDHIVFGAEETAAATAALIRALAVMAHQPGGVNFLDRHWCTDHTSCEAAEVEAVTS